MIRVLAYMVVVLVVTLGCSGSSGSSIDAGAADSDVDVDTDTDSDADTDGDPSGDAGADSGEECIDEEPDLGPPLEEPPCSWKKMESGTEEGLYGIWGSRPDDVHAVGSGGVVLHFDGISWKNTEVDTDDTFFDVHGLPNGSVYAVGYAGVWRYSDGLWEQLCSHQSQSLWPLNDSEMVLANGNVVAGENGCRVAENFSHDDDMYGLTGTTRDLWVDSCGRVFAVYDFFAGLGCSDCNGGEYFEIPGWSGGDPVGCDAVWGISHSSTVIACREAEESVDHYRIHHFGEGGWEDVTPDVRPEVGYLRLASIWGANRNAVFFVGRKGLFYNGEEFLEMEGEVGSGALWGFSDEDVFSVGEGGRISRCTPD